MLMLNYAHTTDKIITSALDYGNGNATLFKNMNSEYKMTELAIRIASMRHNSNVIIQL